MLPIRPEYHAADRVPADGVLAVVSFGSAPPAGPFLSIGIPIPQIGGPVAEVWRVTGSPAKEWRNDVQLALADDVLFGTIRREGCAKDAAIESYDAIVETCRAAGYPNLWRIWNHVGGINDPENGLERYKQFSAGRHEALVRHGYARERFPAASAVGMSEPGLLVYFVAGREAGVQTENPRQVSAYDYPPQYGPRSPSFSRATVVASTLVFISGTASVVGHASIHTDSVEEQLEETIENLEVTLQTAAERVGRTASLSDLLVAKVYIRGGVEYRSIQARLREVLPSAMLLEANICRRELLLEIEGVAALRE